MIIPLARGIGQSSAGHSFSHGRMKAPTRIDWLCEASVQRHIERIEFGGLGENVCCDADVVRPASYADIPRGALIHHGLEVELAFRLIRLKRHEPAVKAV